MTLLRALERRRPPGERIVDDPYAATFLEPPDRVLLAAVRHFPQSTTPALWPGPGDGATTILCRHRFLDERLLAALPGVAQVVLLGAGYDSRAYRFADAIGTRPVFEVDLPAISRRKARIVDAHRELFGDTRPVRVETDFRSSSLRTRLVDAGFTPGAPTFVVWEGVAMYLPRAAVTATLDDVRALCGHGSELALDLVTSFAGRRPRAVAMKIASQSFRLIGEPVRFGLLAADAPGLLAAHGWTVDELLEAPALTRRFATDGRRCQPGLYVLSASAG